MNEHFKPEAPKPRAISQFTRAIFKHRRIFIEAMVGTFVLNSPLQHDGLRPRDSQQRL